MTDSAPISVSCQREACLDGEQEHDFKSSEIFFSPSLSQYPIDVYNENHMPQILLPRGWGLLSLLNCSGSKTDTSVYDYNNYEDSEEPVGSDDNDCELPDKDGDGYDAITCGGNDCDDNSDTVSPGAEEICDDHVDNDCDGTSNNCILTGAVGLSIADAKLIGEVVDNFAGTSVAGAGDVNQDGFADILVGAPFYFEDTDDAGRAYLLYGPVIGESVLSEADVEFEGEFEEFGDDEGDGDRAGWSVAGAGDVDGDGWDDILVGAPLSFSPDFYGAAYLIYGPVNEGKHYLSNSDVVLKGEGTNDYAGGSVAGVGDVNGDGFADIFVGAIGNGSDGEGSAYLVLGPTSGTISLTDADTEFDGESVRDQAGFSVSGGGDVNGDGLDDLLIMAPSYEFFDTGGNWYGVTYIIAGPANEGGNLENADAKVRGEWPYSSLESVADAGDVDGNGFDDILIGAPEAHGDGSSADPGVACLILSPVSGIVSSADADTKFIGVAKDEETGISVAGAGDVDGNGFDDILIGARSYYWGYFSGATYLVYGPMSGYGDVSLAGAGAKLIGEFEGDRSGSSVAGAGDVDGDYKDDILIGAPEYGGSGGAAYLVDGGRL